MQTNYSLQDWYDSIKAKGQCKALADSEHRLLTDVEIQHNTCKAKVQFPIVSKSLGHRQNKKVDNTPIKVDTLDSLFNFF